MKIKIPEAKISSMTIGRYGDVSFRVFVKAEDTENLWDVLQPFWTAGTPITVDIGLFQDESQEKSIAMAEELLKTTLVGANSPYVKFKMFCEDYGINYAKQKEIIGVTHLKDLEKKFTLGEIEEILNTRTMDLKTELGLYDTLT